MTFPPQSSSSTSTKLKPQSGSRLICCLTETGYMLKKDPIIDIPTRGVVRLDSIQCGCFWKFGNDLINPFLYHCKIKRHV